MFRVLFDARLVEKPRGLGRYVRECLNAIGRQNRGRVEIFVLTPRGSEPLVKALGTFNIVSVRAWAIPVWEQIVVPIWASKLKVDVVHSPCNTTPIFLRTERVRQIVTVHDLMFFKLRGANFYQRFGNAYRRFVVSKFKWLQPEIIAVSNATRDAVRDRLGIEASVIHEPVASFVRGRVAELAASVVDRGYSYFIHIGGLAAHKNTEMVIKAFAMADLPNCVLIVLGVPCDSRMAVNLRSERVIFPGWVSDSEVAQYISGAIAMVFPSLMEGYGLPILEAFSLGCPVITSAVAPMDELSNGAAVLVDPTSVAMIAEAFRRISSDEGLRRRLISDGLERARDFSADEIGLELIEKYCGSMECVG